LSKFKGSRPLELFGHTEFPAIGDLPYLLTLGGHAFHWFSIEPPPSDHAADLIASYTAPALSVGSTQSLLRGEDRVALEDALPAFLDTRHWFAGRAFRVSAVRIEDTAALGEAFVVVVRVEYADRDSDRYVLPLAVVPPPPGQSIAPQALVATLKLPDGEAVLVDALEHPATARGVLEAIARNAHVAGSHGILQARS